MRPGEGEGSNCGCGTVGTIASTTFDGLFIERALSVVNIAIAERRKQVDGEYYGV